MFLSLSTLYYFLRMWLLLLLLCFKEKKKIISYVVILLPVSTSTHASKINAATMVKAIWHANKVNEQMHEWLLRE